jgi:DNA-binding transcriptional MocR family regulator
MSHYDEIYSDGNLPQRAKLVYFYLRDRMGGKGVAWPSIRRISFDTSLSRSTVKRAIADLANAGYIRKETAHRQNGSCTSNRYYLV